MSLSMHIYVGPYLRCYPRARRVRVYDVTAGRLDDMQGASSFDPGYAVVGSDEIPGIERTTVWGRTVESEKVVDMSDAVMIDNEIACFLERFSEEVAALRREYDTVKPAWGVVPCWR